MNGQWRIDYKPRNYVGVNGINLTCKMASLSLRKFPFSLFSLWECNQTPICKILFPFNELSIILNVFLTL